nr:PREDICTED: gustatory receptor 68a-like [Tribolium castaneum]|eukprot:XP_015832887.1 PREDICTED: gustatory receptor 68a-like [Tribolium castaneum]
MFYFLSASSHLIDHLNTNCTEIPKHKMVKCYQIYFELKTKIEEMVGFYAFVKITHIVIEVATNIYSFRKDMQDDYSTQKNIGDVVFALNGYWIVQTIFQVILLIYPITEFCSKVAKTVDLFEDKANENNVKRFLVQVYTLPQKFTAHGLFVLDWSLLHFMIGSITTHLVYLIQFKQTSS